MAKIKEPQKVMPFLGLIFVEDFSLQGLLDGLEKDLGPITARSSRIPFRYTTYYNREMGTPLLREWIAFGQLIMPDELVELKHWTNSLEQKSLNESGGRRVNIDPGIVSLGNIILASTKNYAHRLYLGRGIYAEVTLIYQDHQFRPLAWTYPDYQEEAALKFFGRARAVLKNSLKQDWKNKKDECVQ